MNPWKQFGRKSLRRILKSLVEHALPAGELLTGFQTAKGDYLPNRLRILFGSYEAEERRLMRPFLHPGQTILDVGANVGYLTRFLAGTTGPNGRVYAFEPNPLIFPMLERNTASFPQVRAMNYGLSMKRTESTLFFANARHSAGSFAAEFPASHVFHEETTVLTAVQAQLVNGDQFMAEQGVDKIDILKIDVEGWELNVLRGLEKTIAGSPHIAIFCELNRAAQKCAGYRPEQLPAWFWDRNFTLTAPQHHGLHELSRHTIAQWIEQLPAPGYTTLFASRGPGQFPN